MNGVRVVLDTPGALVVAVNSRGGRSAAMRAFVTEVGRAPAFASLEDLRAVGIEAPPSARVRELFLWFWPDPLSFIGRAANEGLR